MQVVAVKKLDTSAAQDNEEFLAAVCTMAHLQHANITELIGYCAEHGQHLLVYQYMNGGTLNDTLHTSDEAALHISWNMRVKIALGAARALEYISFCHHFLIAHLKIWLDLPSSVRAK